MLTLQKTQLSSTINNYKMEQRYEASIHQPDVGERGPRVGQRGEDLAGSGGGLPSPRHVHTGRGGVTRVSTSWRAAQRTHRTRSLRIPLTDSLKGVQSTFWHGVQNESTKRKPIYGHYDASHEVKVRSSWCGAGPQPNVTGVLGRTDHVKMRTHQGDACDNGGHSDAAASGGSPGVATDRHGTCKMVRIL